MKQGGPRPGSGRKSGTVNKKSTEVVAAALVAGKTPVEFMLDMMRDEEALPADRRWAAEKAAPFVCARPAPFARTVQIELPDTSTPDGIVKAAAAILQATAAGDIAPSEAQCLMSVIEMQRKAVETAELVKRIEALEARAAV